MPLTPAEWHRRFTQQAAWTASLRQHLLARLEKGKAARVLEVGCGTGAVLTSLNAYTQFTRIGLDIHLPYLLLASQHDPAARFIGGDALHLPLPNGAFDAVFCHFFLLWIKDPGKALREMVRAARPDGAVIAFAEPDYGGRIDYPPPLEELGRLQALALRSQGANPNMGRTLSGLFHAAGLHNVETGLLGGQWQSPPSRESIESEWATLQADVAGEIPAGQLEALRKIDEAAWQNGERVLFVPTFYAIGWK